VVYSIRRNDKKSQKHSGREVETLGRKQKADRTGFLMSRPFKDARGLLFFVDFDSAMGHLELNCRIISLSMGS